jgi:hypothetical protein
LQRIGFRPTETSGVDFGIFCDRNFGISYPYEVSNEISVEWKPEKFSKFRAKMNDCVVEPSLDHIVSSSQKRHLSESLVIQPGMFWPAVGNNFVGFYLETDR